MSKDLDPDASTVRLLRGEASKARTVSLDPTAFVVIQWQLGHGNLATTSRYLDHLASRQVIEVMRGTGVGGVRNRYGST